MFCETHKLFITFNKVNILEDISINIENEKTTVIIGKNGSGKTVLLRCINNLIRPTSGFLKSKYNIPIPMLFQKPMTFYGTIQYNFEILCNIKKKQPSLKWYHSFNLDKISKKNIYEVSSGEQQKIYLSRIMSIDPEVIIMDEPNQNLDKENDQKLIDLILNEKEKNKTIIFTLHNTEIVKLLIN
jgi:ABC-type Mn2+/Zn2+ transport system ATPase subunit